MKECKTGLTLGDSDTLRKFTLFGVMHFPVFTYNEIYTEMKPSPRYTQKWNKVRYKVHQGYKEIFSNLSAMGRQIDPSWGGPIELFLIPASAPRLV